MVTHWDDIEPRVVDAGDLRAQWRDLGRAAGSGRLGMRRCDIAPGGRSTPAHGHADEEGYGQRDPGDICFYPRSGKVAIRGLNAVFRVQRVDYWEGEA